MSDEEVEDLEGERQQWEAISGPSTQAPLLLSSLRNKPGRGPSCWQIGAGILKNAKAGEVSKDP